MMILKGKGEYYEKEVIFSVWPSGRVIKTEEEHEDSIKTGKFKTLFKSLTNEYLAVTLIS